MRKPMKMSGLLLVILLTACGSVDPMSPVTDSQIKMRFSNQTTSELKLRRNQIIEILAPSPQSNGTKVTVGVRPNGGPVVIGKEKAEALLNEKSDIERELLRRWKTGDGAAHLSIFDQ
jgi:hypothetical protein